MQSTLKNLLEAAKAHPVLFVGSGFTHRYLKTEDWRGLISHFASLAKPETEFAFEYYRNEVSSDGTTDTDLPAITEMVEKDFSRRFLAEPEFAALRSTYSDAIGASISPLKIGVADQVEPVVSLAADRPGRTTLRPLVHARVVERAVRVERDKIKIVGPQPHLVRPLRVRADAGPRHARPPSVQVELLPRA